MDMQIQRLFSDRVAGLCRFFPAIVLTGARQSGKTTLLRQLFPGYAYVSLDLPDAAARAEHSPEEFFARYQAPLIVDEVQYAPGLFRHLKTVIDADRTTPGRYILTGSQLFPLMQEVADSLAGRCAVLELENLTLSEIRQAEVREYTLAERIVRGQFPELWRQQDLPSNEYYASYLATYLERDVRQIMNVRSLRDFERFLRILASRSGNMLNMSDVARDVGVSVKAIGDWVSILEASGQIALLEPWFTNFGKRLVKTSKLYFRDSGLLCFLLGLNPSGLLESPFLGAVWETFVFAELRKGAGLAQHPGKFWYYRDQRAREVDFLYENNGRLDFMECKWMEHPGKKETAILATVADELDRSSLPWKSAARRILTSGSTSWPLAPGIEAVGYPEIMGLVMER